MLCCTQSKIGLALVAGVGAGFVLNASLEPTQAMTQPEAEMKDMSQMSEAEMMEMMMKLAQPGEKHDRLGRVIGEWDVDAKFMNMDGSAVTGEGSMTCDWVLGERFVKTDFTLDEFMGSEFNGIGYNGYDNGEEKYVGIWLDNMSTRVHVMEGEFKDDGSFVSVGPNGFGGLMKIEQTMPDDDTIKDVFYNSDDGGENWTKSGEMTYTRR